MNYLILSIVKIFDNIITTAKSIATYKERKVLSSFLVFTSQFLFYFVISKVISDNTPLSILVVSISAGIGNYIAFTINDKFKKDAKWTMVITSSDKDGLIDFCNYLKKNKIRYVANNGYNRKWEETINVICFSRTKEESKMIENHLNNSNMKYLKEVI